MTEVPLPGDSLGARSFPRWQHREEIAPFEEGYMEEDDFYEDDEDPVRFADIFQNSATGVTVPPADFLRQVRAAVTYRYEAGEYPPDMTEAVACYLEPDGGLLDTIDLAIRLLDEHERRSEHALPEYRDIVHSVRS